jgi:hypothetical protein
VAVGAHPATASASPYERRAPESTVLYETLQEHWRSFVADLESSAEPPALPAFVTAEIESFLRCGILAHGFVLARCGECDWSRPVAFSCKRRGFCPSCIGRRMADFAAHLVDRVVPTVPLRQWVLTVPYPLRARMMFDPALTSVVLRQLVAAVSSWLHRRARRLGVEGALKTGAIAVIQRFNSAAAASPHFHTLFLDGVFAFRAGTAPMFHPTPAPRDEDIARVAASVFRRVERRLAAREPSAAQRRFEEESTAWCALASASVAGVSATGLRRGRALVRVRGPHGAVALDAVITGRLCAVVSGFNLQAATRVPARDREGLERMARYLARPPIANDRLTRLDDGRLQLELKRPWRDGTTAFVSTPHELIERLVALVPRPRAHLTRYFGVFAPAFAARAEIVPSDANTDCDRARVAPTPPDGATPPPLRRRYPWASLIWRVFLQDVLECARCHGRMTIVAALTAPLAVGRVLRHLGLPTEAPQLHPARPPPQAELRFDREPAPFYADPLPREDFEGT